VLFIGRERSLSSEHYKHHNSPLPVLSFAQTAAPGPDNFASLARALGGALPQLHGFAQLFLRLLKIR
jgi:hypothetical protein